MSLSSQQRRAFDETGLLWLKNQYSLDYIDQLRESVRSKLTALGVAYDDFASWSKLDAKGLRRVLRECKRKIPGIANFYSDNIRRIAAELLGSSIGIREMRAGLLLTPPRSLGYGIESAEEWRIPSTIWHCDLGRTEKRDLQGLRVFLYLDDVQPRGGGTLMITGSHRLCQWERRLSSKQVKRHLKKYDYFKQLWDKDSDSLDLLDKQMTVAGINIELTELSGNKGDLLIWDPRLLHTIAPNVLDRPRLVAEGMFLSETLFETIRDQPRST